MSRVKTISLKLIFTASMLDIHNIKNTCGKQAGKIVAQLEKALNRILPIPNFEVEDMWRPTPKRLI